MYLSIARHLQQSNLMLTTSSHIRTAQIDSNFKDSSLRKPLTPTASQNLVNQAGKSNSLNTNNELERYIKPRKQLISMLMCVIIVFYVCLFPLKIWNMILMFFGHIPGFQEIITLRRYWYINITARILFYGNNMINPILYNWLSKKFRKGFKRLVTCKHFKDQYIHTHHPDGPGKSDLTNLNKA